MNSSMATGCLLVIFFLILSPLRLPSLCHIFSNRTSCKTERNFCWMTKICSQHMKSTITSYLAAKLHPCNADRTITETKSIPVVLYLENSMVYAFLVLLLLAAVGSWSWWYLAAFLSAQYLTISPDYLYHLSQSDYWNLPMGAASDLLFVHCSHCSTLGQISIVPSVHVLAPCCIMLACIPTMLLISQGLGHCSQPITMYLCSAIYSTLGNIFTLRHKIPCPKFTTSAAPSPYLSSFLNL